MNTNAKGYRNETKTKEYLEALGFIVHSTVRSSHRGNNDIFNLFDHIAVSTKDFSSVRDVTKIGISTDFGSEPRHKMFLAQINRGDTLYVQTTSNRNKPKAVREAIAAFPATNKQIFIWYDRIKEPKIINL